MSFPHLFCLFGSGCTDVPVWSGCCWWCLTVGRWGLEMQLSSAPELQDCVHPEPLQTPSSLRCLKTWPDHDQNLNHNLCDKHKLSSLHTATYSTITVHYWFQPEVAAWSYWKHLYHLNLDRSQKWHHKNAAGIYGLTGRSAVNLTERSSKCKIH